MHNPSLLADFGVPAAAMVFAEHSRTTGRNVRGRFQICPWFSYSGLIEV
jgi:hypothetical protein